MSDHELDMWVAFLCAAYDGTPVTVERNRRGKITDIKVHDTENGQDETVEQKEGEKNG